MINGGQADRTRPETLENEQLNGVSIYGNIAKGFLDFEDLADRTLPNIEILPIWPFPLTKKIFFS